jgi:DNA polymerase-3 subunit alpha
MSVEMDDTDKLKILFDDAIEMGLSFENPDINLGEYRFSPITPKSIRYGLGAIKGTGQSAIDAICEARTTGGAFKSLFDFCARVDRNRINKRAVEALIRAGAFDSIWVNRHELIASVALAFDYASSQESHVLQSGLFDLAHEHGSSTNEPLMVNKVDWGPREKLTHEKSAIGFHLSGHLFDEVQEEVRCFVKTSLAELKESRDPVWVAGIVRDERTINTTKGRLHIFILDDGSTALEITSDEAVFSKHKSLIKEDQLLIALVKIQNDRRSGGFRLGLLDAMDLPHARCRFGKYVKLYFQKPTHALTNFLKEQIPPPLSIGLQPQSHRLGVRLHVTTLQGEGEIQLGAKAQFYPTDELLLNLKLKTSAVDSMVIYE